MYARFLTLNLKSNRLNDFTKTFDTQVIPMLSKQTGFKDAIAFAGPSGTEICTISLWDSKENAESYNRTTYPEVQKLLANVLEGTPQIKTYDVVNSTFHKIPTLPTVATV
jgi:heme-degrading monooxygenase HmoA